ncbi:hypothetical protein GGF43_002743 [Coemansia sp. RSA 2618]|nr:hypothetical protein GGF43_002743 [Coemansia sp. RSA 2618]
MPLSHYAFSPSRWPSQSTLVGAPSSEPSVSHHPLFGAYYTGDMLGKESMRDDTAREQAQIAHDLLASVRRRQTQLARFLQAYSTHKANPLGGAMCAELEEKIHQMALLIRTQQQQLKCIVDEHDGPCSDVSSEGEADDAGEAEVPEGSPPVSNWLATIRMAVLKEVVEFSSFEQARIEESKLLTKYPASGLGRQQQHQFSPLSPSIY